MAESAKYMPVNGGFVVSDLKFTKIFSFTTKRTRAFDYVFIVLIVFLAFNPSSNPSSPWFSNIFSGSSFGISSSRSGGSTNLQRNGTKFHGFFPSPLPSPPGKGLPTTERRLRYAPMLKPLQILRKESNLQPTTLEGFRWCGGVSVF